MHHRRLVTLAADVAPATDGKVRFNGVAYSGGVIPANGYLGDVAIANGRDEGVTKRMFDDSPEAHGHGKILGGDKGRLVD